MGLNVIKDFDTHSLVLSLVDIILFHLHTPTHAVKPPHCFALQDLIQDALTTDKVLCPRHNGLVDLEILVSRQKEVFAIYGIMFLLA